MFFKKHGSVGSRNIIDTQVDQCVIIHNTAVQQFTALDGCFLPFLILDVGGFGEQLHRTDLQRDEMLLIEISIVIVTVVGAQQF